MLSLRPSDYRDAGALWHLIDKHREELLLPGETFEPAQLLAILRVSYTLVDASNWPVGIAWYDDHCVDGESDDKSYVTIHLIIDPRHYKEARKQRLFEKIIDNGFIAYQAAYILAFPHICQISAMGLLARFGFKIDKLIGEDTPANGRTIEPIAKYKLEKEDWTTWKDKHA